MRTLLFAVRYYFYTGIAAIVAVLLLACAAVATAVSPIALLAYPLWNVGVRLRRKCGPAKKRSSTFRDVIEMVAEVPPKRQANGTHQ